MSKSRLTESQAIEIAKQEFKSLGGKGNYYADLGTLKGEIWVFPIFSEGQNDHLDIPEIRIYDETGLIVPHHIVKSDREARQQAYQQELQSASLSAEQVIEIATKEAGCRGHDDFEISPPRICEGFWHVSIILDSSRIDVEEYLETDTLIFVDDGTGRVVAAPLRADSKKSSD